MVSYDLTQTNSCTYVALTLLGSVSKSTFSLLGLIPDGASSLSPFGTNCRLRLVPVAMNV